jgi:hypothetical protein
MKTGVASAKANIRKHNFVFGDDSHSRISVMKADFAAKKGGAQALSKGA